MSFIVSRITGQLYDKSQIENNDYVEICISLSAK